MKQEDVDTIVRAFEDQYAAAFGRKDAKALAALLTEDVTLLSEWGDIQQGRATIEQMLTKVFPVLPGDLSLENTPRRSAAITEDVIVSHGTSRKVADSVEEKLVYTRVLVRQPDGSWLLAATQVAPPSSMPDPRPDSP